MTSRAMRSVGLSPGREFDTVLITRHVDFSLPYRVFFTQPQVVDLQEHLLDDLTVLLVRLHLAGFFWGGLLAVEYVVPP
jgi:hypothetical protein